MRQKKFFATAALLILPLIVLVTGCSTANNVSSKTEDYLLKAHVKQIGDTHYAQTDPNMIAILKKSPKQSTKIAVVSVERTNLVGIKRQAGTVHDLMCRYAALVGGDAITNLRPEGETDVGDVVKFGHKA